MLDEIKTKFNKIIYDKLATLPEELNDTVTLNEIDADETDLIMILMHAEKVFRIDFEDASVTLNTHLSEIYSTIHNKILANITPDRNEGI